MVAGAKLVLKFTGELVNLDIGVFLSKGDLKGFCFTLN